MMQIQYLLIAVIAVVAVAAVLQNTLIPSIPIATDSLPTENNALPPSETGARITNDFSEQELLSLKSQLQNALVSGGITPELYEDIDLKIKGFEERGMDQELISEVRSMLDQLEVGGQQETTNQEINAEESANQEIPNPVVEEEIPVIWVNYESGEWIPRGTPPECPKELVFQSPVDLSLASAILYPGQVRGGDFKPHGGFRTDGVSGKIEVRAPMEGYIWNAAKFNDEFGVHYMFDIQHPCGIMHRLGHLGEVPEKLEKIFDTFPKAEYKDSRTREVVPAVYVELGEVIAINTQKGSGFDWGAYDLRQENEAAQDSAFRKAHADEAPQAYHALCWFNYLPDDQEAIVRSLPAADGISGKKSDYC